ncbi:MAG: peptide deformylase [Bdellovibrionales bacterium]|nr:peptide deformylase [Bdellovibrionales bacterium]
MALLDIVLFPDARLREPCDPVTEVTDQIRQQLRDMAETMYDAPGIGLAAPQVGLRSRLIVVDVGSDDEPESPRRLYQLVNPEITASEGQVDSEEGCLSIPTIRETVQRFERISVAALDEQGQPITIDADGLLAICLQHEIDHLNGILFIDYLSKLKQQLIKSKLKKLAQR